MEGDGTDMGMQTTVARCMDFCAGYDYFGLQFYSECWCGNTYGDFGEADDESECNSPCRGDESTMCGGSWRNSIYEIIGTETTSSFSDWVPVPEGGSVECSAEALGVDDPRPGSRLDCHCSESGTGTDAAYCAHERGGGFPYPGCTSCSGPRTGAANQQGGGFTCSCLGSNAMVRIGAGPAVEYKGCLRTAFATSISRS